jgi:hypothetical protein
VPFIDFCGLAKSPFFGAKKTKQNKNEDEDKKGGLQNGGEHGDPDQHQG